MAPLHRVSSYNSVFVYDPGIIPSSWRRYTVPAGLTVIQWITDFSERIKQLHNVSNLSATGGASALKVMTVLRFSNNNFLIQQFSVCKIDLLLAEILNSLDNLEIGCDSTDTMLVMISDLRLCLQSNALPCNQSVFS